MDWSKPSTALLHQRRRQPPHPIVNPVALILLIPIAALLIIFFIVSPFLSHTQNLLRPNSVNKSWDSLVILLVIFAIICGVFARRNDDVSATEYYSRRRKAFCPSPTALRETGANRRRLRRSSSSYPDLRQVSEWETGDDNRYRFFDDFEVIRHRSTGAGYDCHRRQRPIGVERGGDDIKVIPVDYVETRNSPPNPPPPPPPPSVKLKRRRSVNNVERQLRAPDFANRRSTAPPPPPPPPPPPAMMSHLAGEDTPKLQRKKSATKEIATAIASLYNQTKRKRRTKSRNYYESTSDNSPPSGSPLPPQTPPPPPPPPPSKGFQNLFKKSSKNKRVHSVSPSIAVPPPPPPFPPPPNSIFNNFFKSSSTSKRFNQSQSTTPPPPPPPPPPTSILDSQSKNGNKSRRTKSAKRASVPPPPPPPPARSSSIRETPAPPPYVPPHRRPSASVDPPMSDKPARNYYEENLNSGAQSPLIPMPPPPPPPPFRMREMKFVARGDFVRIRSSHSSWCSSPEIDDGEGMSVKSEQPNREDLIGPAVYCPSPDVNSKAESFIARLRDEWRLEKMNSIRENRKLG